MFLNFKLSRQKYFINIWANCIIKNFDIWSFTRSQQFRGLAYHNFPLKLLFYAFFIARIAWSKKMKKKKLYIFSWTRWYTPKNVCHQTAWIIWHERTMRKRKKYA